MPVFAAPQRAYKKYRTIRVLHQNGQAHGRHLALTGFAIMARFRHRIVLKPDARAPRPAALPAPDQARASSQENPMVDVTCPIPRLPSALRQPACPMPAQSPRKKPTPCSMPCTTPCWWTRTQAEWNFVGGVPGAVCIEWKSFPGMQPNPGFSRCTPAPSDAHVLFLCRFGRARTTPPSPPRQPATPSFYNVLEGFGIRRQRPSRAPNGW